MTMLVLSRVSAGTSSLSRPPKEYQALFGLLGIVENPLPRSSALAFGHSVSWISPLPHLIQNLQSQIAVLRNSVEAKKEGQ